MKLPFSRALLLVLCFIVVDCSQPAKPRLTPTDQPYVDLYADLMIVQTGGPPRDSALAYRRVVDSVYHAHNLDSAALATELQKFKTDPPFAREFYEKVIAQLEKEKKALPPIPPPKLP